VLPILITCGVLALLGASANLLLYAGRVRAIAPVAATIVAVALFASAGVAHAVAPRGHGPHGLGRSDADVPCTGATKPIGPAARPLPTAAKGSKRHPPFRIDGLPGTSGPVVRASQFDYGPPGGAPAMIGNALLDHDAYYYVTASDSSRTSFQMEVGTPRAGYCAQELVYTVLRGDDGMRTQLISTLTPGPALAGRHAVLACGVSSSGSGLSACAWASTAKTRPLFGAIWIFPTYKPDGFAEHQLSHAEIVAFVDTVYAAVYG
jgi:hypothetical protein